MNTRLLKYFFVLYFFTLGTLFAQTEAKRPNIIFIISDDHAAQSIGCYGAEYKQTPNLDKLAEQGVRFTNACVNNALCGPSRAAFLTAKFSHKNGFKDNLSRFDGSQDSFAKQLQTNGYQTAWIGKWHLESQPQGFDFWKVLVGQGYYFNPDFLEINKGKVRNEGYVTDIITNESEKWLDNRDKSKPFCLVVGHKATHRIWQPVEHVLDDYKFTLPKNFYDNYEKRIPASMQEMSIDKDMKLGYDLKIDAENTLGENYKRMSPEQKAAFDAYYKPIEAEFLKSNLKGKELAEWKYQRYMHDYVSTAVSLDKNIGELMDYLDKNGLTENTIVVYTSDNGFFLGEHGWFDKRFMYEEAFKVPLIVRYPQMIKPKTVSNELVENIDFGPTFLDLAGAQIPKDMQGKSMVPLLAHNKKFRDYAYYHYYEWGEHKVVPQFGIKTKRYKIIRFHGVYNGWEFYDLEKDPSEMSNLYGNPKYKKIIDDMKKKLGKVVDQYEDTDAKKILDSETILSIPLKKNILKN